MANRIFVAVEHEFDGKMIKSVIRISEVIAVVDDKVYTKDSIFSNVKNSEVVRKILLEQTYE